MKRTCLVLVLIVPAWSACASSAGSSRVARGGLAGPRVAPVPVTGTMPQDAVPPAGRTSGFSESELSLWRDPAFQKRFAESYLAETEIEPRISEPEGELLNEVRDLIVAEKPRRAIALIEKELTDASSAAFDCMLGNLYFQLEQPDQAALHYLVAVEKHPKFRRAWRNLGMLYVRENDFERALPALTRVVEQGGADGVTYGLLGFAYANAEDPIAAESAYRMAILLDPSTMDWKLGLVRSFFKQGRFAEAAALCDNLIAKHPEETDLWLLQANAYVGLEKPLAAAENFELVDRLGKATPESLNLLGDIYVNEGLFPQSVASYRRALELDPQADLDRLVRAARVLTSRAAYSEARELVDAIEVARGDGLAPQERKELLKLRARMAVASGAGEEEARVLEEIVSLDPLDGEALILLAQYNGRAGDTERAVLLYERAAGLEAYEADAKVGHAQLLVRNGSYAQALPLLRRAQELDPRDNVQRFLEQIESLAQRK